MSTTLNARYPRLTEVFAASRKTAAGVTDPGPDSGHPASPEGNLSVPTGETLSAADEESQASLGDLSAASAGEPAGDRQVVMNTEVAPVGDHTTDMDIKMTVPDPGPDSEHPASPSNQKNAAVEACKTVDQLVTLMGNCFKQLEVKIASFEKKLAGQPAGDNSAPAKADPAIDDEDEGEIGIMPAAKVAAILQELVPDVAGPDGVSFRTKVATMLQSNLEPIVADAYDRADSLVSFMKLAEVDPAAAAAMMSADPAAMADPAMMGGDPAAMGGDPAMMGGDPGAMGGDPGEMGGGGGDPMQELQAAIEEVAQEYGMDPQQLLELLSQEAGEGGDPGVMGGGAPAGAPPAAGPPEGAAPEAASSGPPADAASPAEESGGSDGGEDDEGSKEASFDKRQGKLLRKLASKLATELGKTPAQIARDC